MFYPAYMMIFQVVMEFRKCEQHAGVLLPRFSVAVMSSDARYEWAHGITPRSTDIVRELEPSRASSPSPRLTLMKRGVRTSLTFRNVLHSAVCQCSMYFQVSARWKLYCFISKWLMQYITSCIAVTAFSFHFFYFECRSINHSTGSILSWAEVDYHYSFWLNLNHTLKIMIGLVWNT